MNLFLYVNIKWLTPLLLEHPQPRGAGGAESDEGA